MSDEPIVENTEELREALLSLRQDHDRLTERGLYAQQLLEALETLLVESAEDPLERLFAALRRMFTFEQALMLVSDVDATSSRLECVVADPVSPVGSRWPIGPLFRKVMAGRVMTTLSNESVEEWQGDHIGAMSRAQSALYVPVRVRERRGILMLLRPGGSDGFARSQVALAERLSVLVSHALATRFAMQTAAENGALHELTAQLRRSEQAARRNLDLLNEMVDVLPVGVTVQDEQGRVQVVNSAAAHALGSEPADLIGKPAPLLLCTANEDGTRSGDRFARTLERAGQHAYELDVTIHEEPHTLLVTDKPVRIFDENLLVSTTLDITERKRFEEELSRQAFHDQLTGLPNRVMMHRIVEKTIVDHEPDGLFALAFIDLDNFKQVNDRYGHAIGDALLEGVSDRIGASIRKGDTLGRISGDEFLLLIDPLDGYEGLSLLIQRVIDALKEPFVIEGHEILTSASIGTSAFPLHGRNYESLRRCADNAMYRAKSERKGTVRYFDAAMGSTLTARMELEQRLRRALLECRFRAAYQAKLDIRTGHVYGFEALCRWIEPDGAVILPGTFIELALELGLLDAITHIMLEDVIDSLPAIESAFGPEVSISLNISAKQAGDVQFMDSIVHRLTSPRIAPRLVLELTEDALVINQRFRHHVLPKLRQLGVRVSIDDFGTGHTSLSTLADITADEIKVDRAFITAIQERPRSQGLLRAIESLCAALDIDVVAEGVETLAELDYLKADTSIRRAQGFHFHRPQTLDALLAWTGNGTARTLAGCA